MQPPPLPPLEGMHPLVVHLPLGLLMAAPVLVVLSVLFAKHARGFAWAALTMLALGTGGAVAAKYTGEAAEEVAEAQLDASGVGDDPLHEHEEAAERAVLAFAVLTALYAAVVVAPVVRRKEWSRPVHLGLNAGVLALWAVAALLLANAGHLGGLLVHKYGVRAPTAESTGAVDRPGDGAGRDDDGDGDDRGRNRRGR